MGVWKTLYNLNTAQTKFSLMWTTNRENNSRSFWAFWFWFYSINSLCKYVDTISFLPFSAVLLSWSLPASWPLHLLKQLVQKYDSVSIIIIFFTVSLALLVCHDPWQTHDYSKTGLWSASSDMHTDAASSDFLIGIILGIKADLGLWQNAYPC